METVKTRTFIGWLIFMENKKKVSEKMNTLSVRLCIRCDDALPKKWSHAMCADCLEETNE